MVLVKSKTGFVHSLGKKELGYILIILSITLILVLVFVKSNYDSQGAFVCENIEATGGSMAQCPVHKTDTSWFFLAGFGVAIIVGMIGFYFGFIEKEPLAENLAEKGNDEKSVFPAEVDVSKLDLESQEIIRIIQSKNGSAYQSDLVKGTSFSKVKISRILDRLEHENIIERKRRGMANLVVLR